MLSGRLATGLAALADGSMNITIQPERPDSPDAIALIIDLNAALNPDKYPAESIHGFSIEKLIAQNVAFFVIWAEGTPAGCGGVKLYTLGKKGESGQRRNARDDDRTEVAYGEVKRMFVRPEWRGQGLAQRMLDTLEDHAARHDIRRMRLETGIYQRDAIRLYTRAGYREIGPFGEYRLDPLSRYFEKALVLP